jgi:hypothetical protein
LTAQPGRKKGLFNRQIAPAKRKRWSPLDFAPESQIADDWDIIRFLAFGSGGPPIPAGYCVPAYSFAISCLTHATAILKILLSAGVPIDQETRAGDLVVPLRWRQNIPLTPFVSR